MCQNWLPWERGGGPTNRGPGHWRPPGDQNGPGTPPRAPKSLQTMILGDFSTPQGQFSIPECQNVPKRYPK